MIIRYRHRLTFKQARNTVIITLILGIIMSIIQVGYDLIKEQEKTDQAITEFMGILKDSASEALYTLDATLGESVINGLFKNKSVRSVKITDENQSVLVERERETAKGLLARMAEVCLTGKKQYESELIYEVEVYKNGVFHTEKKAIGKLVVLPDTNQLFKAVWQRILLIIAGETLRASLLAIILTLIFYSSLMKPLLAIIHHVSIINPAKPAEKPIPYVGNTDRDELDLLVNTTNSLLHDFETSLALQRASKAELQKHRDHFENLVNERTEVLRETLDTVKENNRKLFESIRYARMIQQSILPDMSQVKTYLPDSFIIWRPRDIVGGDLYFTINRHNTIIIVVADCTGHGVPGALMTMIASTSLKRIIADEGESNPAIILEKLNYSVKTLLKQHTDSSGSDDGLDAAICLIELYKGMLTFSGAKLPLMYVDLGEPKPNSIELIKGDKQSIGYKKSDLNFRFTNHTVHFNRELMVYLATDGFASQLGGSKRQRFGTKQLKHLLSEHCDESFDDQERLIISAFKEYAGNNIIQDDITLIGLKVKKATEDHRRAERRRDTSA